MHEPSGSLVRSTCRGMVPVALLGCLITVGCGRSDVDRLLADLAGVDDNVRHAAVRELGTIPDPPPRVVQALESATSDRDPRLRQLACVALGVSQNGAAALNAALEDDVLSVRMAAAFALLESEPSHAAAAKVLTRAMKLGDGGVIVNVSRRGQSAEWAIPTLINLLNDRRPGIRRLAVEGLGHIGIASPEVLKALESAQRDEDDRVLRDAVKTAINQINW